MYQASKLKEINQHTVRIGRGQSATASSYMRQIKALAMVSRLVLAENGGC